MNLFEHTLYINLDSRTDRRDHAEEVFKKMNITAERVNGEWCSWVYIKSY